MTKVNIETSLGNIIVRLYDETPFHRDNFIRLVKEGFYVDTLFHRVIKDFMIQGGDPDSKNAPSSKMLGMGGPGYNVQAEILPNLFHKRGALAAARQGDEVNPERESSGSQFYIVWGQIYKPSQIPQLNKQRQIQATQQIFSTLASQHRAEILQLRKDRNQAGLMELQERLIKESEAEAKKQGIGLTQEQMDLYTTVGGTPHLDGQYTVFGEVEEGMDVVEKIQSTSTQRGDRPKEDIKILSTTIVE